jgi:DNA-binding CsgD family transcriptional regulator
MTPTEAKVVRLISLGCTTRQVATILGIAESTADNHRWRAMKKLDVHTSVALTRTAINLGITSLSDRLTDEELAKLGALPGESHPPADRAARTTS